jgi:hypothetical protein
MKLFLFLPRNFHLKIISFIFTNLNKNAKSLLLILYFFILGVFLTPSLLYSEPNAFIDIQKIPMEGLNGQLPQAHELALRRINQYRKGLKLPLWVYDDDLSKMAQLHADYVLINCKAGKKKFGHFEDPTYENYTKEGDEAARTSGLSGGPDPLYGLERLIEGVYHRAQFVHREKMRVGIGFSHDPKSFCGTTLFVTRPVKEISQPNLISKDEFILFPPEDFQDNNIRFISEWPDPRPEPSSKRSGYLASISIPNHLIKSFQSANVVMRDSQGNQVEIWLTDPKNPTYKNPPAGMDAVYGKSSNGNPFSNNFGMVFIMPKIELKMNEEYSIAAKLNFEEENSSKVINTKDIQWKFHTRKNQNWMVKVSPVKFSLDDFDFIKNHFQTGDSLEFSEGVHNIQKGIWFDDEIHISGAGIKKTILRIENPTPNNGYILNFKSKNNSLSHLTIFAETMGAIFMSENSSLKLDSISIEDAVNTSLLIQPNAEIISKDSLFLNLGSTKSAPICIRKNAKFLLEEGNFFQNILNQTNVCGSAIETKNKLWNVGVKSDITRKIYSLTDALRLFSPNDTIQLEPGLFKIDNSIWFQEKLQIVGSENGSKIVNSSKDPIFHLAKNIEINFSKVSFEGECGFFTQQTNSTLNLIQTKVKTNSTNCYFGVMDGKSILNLDKTDFTEFASDLFLYLRSKDGKIIQKENLFPNGKSLQPIETAGSGFIQRLK